METGVKLNSELDAVPAKVPGSVQFALRNAGIIPDWNYGLDALQCEWVENRHWIFETELPVFHPDAGSRYILCCQGLDHAGWVLINGIPAHTFESAFIPYEFDLSAYLTSGQKNILQIIFDTPPRYQGQFGKTADYTVQKPRFYYTWDWMPRMVQIGIWDRITLEERKGSIFNSLSATTTSSGFTVHGEVCGDRGILRVQLFDGEQLLFKKNIPVAGSFFETADHLPVEQWWPNGMGEQKLYQLSCVLMDDAGRILDQWDKRIGFRDIHWERCENSADDADPWLCTVNNKPVFLQGVNWTPVLPNFADTVLEQYERLISLYRDMGCNILRIWGGAALEKEIFYELCDRAGLMLWQEFPLSSSGTESIPPSDEYSLTMFSAAAYSYIMRLQHHPALILWGGGNELNRRQGRDGMGTPCDGTEPLLKRFRELVEKFDPGRRFVPTSPTGPAFSADEKNYGKHIHWDVHGPWKNPYADFSEWEAYWRSDDALLRSETGAAGASSAELINKYRKDIIAFPADEANPLWRRMPWWNDWAVFKKNFGRTPVSLEEFTVWSTEYQACELKVAAQYCKARFPECGGFIIWMGHDSFPCTANTSIIDFELNPKPAFFVLREVFRSPVPATYEKQLK